MDEELIQSFKEIKTIFDDLAIDYWLDAGTLLWCFREGHIKPNDKDIDLGSYHKQVYDCIEEIRKKALKMHYSLMVNDSKLSFYRPGVRVTFHIYKSYYENSEHTGYYKTCVFVDKHPFLASAINYLVLDGLTSFANDIYEWKAINMIKALVKEFFLRFPRENELYRILVNFSVRFKILKYYELIYPRYFFENLKKAKFYGTYVLVPSHTDKYLTYCYGNWRERPVNFPRDGYYQNVSKNAKEMFQLKRD